MPVTAFNSSASLLQGATLKGYRELLKTLRQNSEESTTPSALYLQARVKENLFQLRRSRENLDPRRAFQHLRERLLLAKRDLKDLKEAKRTKWQAAYAALLDQRQSNHCSSESQLSATDAALLGADNFARKAVLGVVGALSKGFMELFTSTEIEGQQILQQAFSRPAGQGMITVSNHTAALDDPLLLAAMMPEGSLLQPSQFRWGMCATDRCFKSDLMSAFFRAGKTLPIERGKGIDQAGMRAAQARLQEGDWVHIFPEGTRSRSGEMGPIRKGIGHIIASCPQRPIVIPFVHSGMDRVLPPGKSLPRIGQQVRIFVGEPISFKDLVSEAEAEEWLEEDLSTAIAQRVASTLYQMKAALDGTAIRAALSEATVPNNERAVALSLDRIYGLTHSWRQPSALRKMWTSNVVSLQQPTDTLKLSKQSLRQRLTNAKTSMAASSSSMESFWSYWQSRSSAMTQLAM